MPKITFETFLMNGFICRKVCKMHYFSAKQLFLKENRKKCPKSLERIQKSYIFAHVIRKQTLMMVNIAEWSSW